MRISVRIEPADGCTIDFLLLDEDTEAAFDTVMTWLDGQREAITGNDSPYTALATAVGELTEQVNRMRRQLSQNAHPSHGND